MFELIVFPEHRSQVRMVSKAYRRKVKSDIFCFTVLTDRAREVTEKKAQWALESKLFQHCLAV